MKIIHRLCCFMALFVMSLCDASIMKMASQNSEEKKISSRSKNTSLKTIKIPYGDIIDCVHISHQPAFDYPLLKNHTIQMMPSSFPKELSNENEITQPIIQFWQLNGSCPDGTIPIRRTTQKDLLIARSIKKKLITPQIHPSGDGGHHEYACVASSSKYNGATANMNVWRPKVQDNEGFSLSQFWIVGGFGSSLNTIEIGWIRDSYQKTGCYNLLCSGFVQLSKRIALGIEIRPQSSYHGPQHEIILTVWKDRRGTWWLRLGKEVICYRPAALFTSLADGASVVQWGGELVTPILSGPHTTTQMGSGDFAEERFKGASYMRNLHVVDASNTLRSPGQFNYVVGNPNCYNLKLGRSRVWEDYFFYGGPGRNPKCP